MVTECANTSKNSMGKKAMNITWNEDEDKESNPNEENRTDDNHVTSLTTNLQSIANTNQLSSIGQNLLNEDSVETNYACTKCEILIDNLKAEQERNVAFLAKMKYVVEERFVIAVERDTLLKL